MVTMVSMTSAAGFLISPRAVVAASRTHSTSTWSCWKFTDGGNPSVAHFRRREHRSGSAIGPARLMASTRMRAFLACSAACQRRFWERVVPCARRTSNAIEITSLPGFGPCGSKLARRVAAITSLLDDLLAGDCFRILIRQSRVKPPKAFGSSVGIKVFVTGSRSFLFGRELGHAGQQVQPGPYPLTGHTSKGKVRLTSLPWPQRCNHWRPSRRPYSTISPLRQRADTWHACDPDSAEKGRWPPPGAVRPSPRMRS